MFGASWSTALGAALSGAVLGSFLNSLALALVGRGSLLRPRSACPACGLAIAPRDLLPLLSWLLLRGRCRRCRAPISPLYPLAEAAAAALALAWVTSPLTPAQSLWGLGFSLALLTLALADLWAGLVPDLVVLPALGLALAGSLAGGQAMEALAGALVVGGGLWAVALAFRLLAGRDGLGLGDVKLGALLGALLGWEAGAQAVLWAAGLGVACILLRGRRAWERPLPFAPCLALAGVAWLLIPAWGGNPWL